MKYVGRMLLGAVALVLAAGVSAAQLAGEGAGGFGGANGLGGTSVGGIGGFRGGGGGGLGRGGRARALQDYTRGNEPIEPLPADRNGVAMWTVDPHFKSDVFTFVRIRFTTARGAGGFGGGGFGGGGGYGRSALNGASWKNDWPDADLNLSFRLQQLTSLKVNPTPVTLELTDPRLFDYPFIYMQQVALAVFTQPEIKALQRYLLNGGFLMVGDFWGDEAAAHWNEQLRLVFPDRVQQDLTLEHPIFHCVFDMKKLPEIPTLQFWQRDRLAGHPENASRAADGSHFRGIFDEKGRMMVFSCQNVDTGDAFQREAEDEEYFHRFSESNGYPLGINTIFYALTH